MRLPVILLAFVLLGCVPQKARPTGTEVLLGPTLSGWTFVDRIPSADGTTARYLRYGETPERWTQMITTVTSPKTTDASFESYMKRIALGDESSCAVPAVYTHPTELNRDYMTILYGFNCGRTLTDGQGKIAMLVMIEGNDAFYQVRHIWRVSATSESMTLKMTDQMTDEGLQTIGSVRVCDNGRPSRKC